MNSKNRVTFGGVGVVGEGGGVSMEAHATHRMTSLRLAMDVHGEMVHVRLSNHSGIVMSCGLELRR